MTDKKKGLIFILSGPSGVGKGTVRKKLNMEKLNMLNSVSLTTRDPRDGEKDGIDYHFVTPETFQKAIDSDAFLEHAGYLKKAYGTPKAPLEEAIGRGQNMLLEIEVNGAHTVMKKKPEAISIFLVPPTLEELVRRITGRNQNTAEEIEGRMKRAKEEMKFKDDYDYVVVNDDADECAARVQQIMEEEIKKYLSC